MIDREEPLKLRAIKMTMQEKNNWISFATDFVKCNPSKDLVFDILW